MESVKDASFGDLNFDINDRIISFSKNGKQILSINAGTNLPKDSRPKLNQISNSKAVYNWERVATLEISKCAPKPAASGSIPLQCYEIAWKPLTKDFIAADSVDIGNAYWYGGAEMFEQHWPINQQHQRLQPYVTNDFFQGESSCGDLLERFWLSSTGAGIYVDDHIPLHASFNADGDGKMIFKADYDHSEYKNIDNQLPKLSYSVCLADDVKKLWKSMYNEFYELPTSVPDERMFKSPIWSTWARYKVDITQSKVIEYAQEIVKHKFSNSQIELDDMYTTKYGEFDFDPEKFPDPKQMVKELHELGFRFTSWMHPFANYDSLAFDEGVKKGYWVRNAKETTTALTRWWQGVGAIIDPTKKEANDWFVSRLRKFQTTYAIDSFKFDAGEANWVPPGGATSTIMANPSEYTQHYVDMVSTFGPMIETRVGFKTQKYPIFVRMMDKVSTWDYQNGLKTMIPSALLMSMLGYHFILPDMIGGNGYADPEEVEKNPESWAHTTILPSKELFIRWTQLSAYMPSMQFSIAPWQYDQETIDICRQAVTEHEEIVTPIVIEGAREAVKSGTPIMRPLWWHDPSDNDCLKCDSQYLVSDTLLVAPILEKDGRSRDVYIPRGMWRDNLRGDVLEGPRWLKDYNIALHEIGTFTLIHE